MKLFGQAVLWIAIAFSQAAAPTNVGEISRRPFKQLKGAR